MPAHGHLSDSMHLTVATSFATWPPNCGAALRNFHLYRNIARRHPTEIIALVKQESGNLDSEIAPHLVERRFVISPRHLEEELKICAKANGRHVGDFAVARLHPLTPRFGAALRHSCVTADVVVASHPHLFRPLRAMSSKPLVYEAPDVEIDLKTAHLPDTLDGRRLLQQIARTEALCLAEADLVLACNQRDRDRFVDVYGTPHNKILIAPNGCDAEHIPFISWQQRLQARGSGERPWSEQPDHRLTGIFLASLGGPNDESADFIVELASAITDVHFVIAGSVGRHVRDKRLPPNLTVETDISDARKLELLAGCDVGLNPVLAGSGDNLKVGEYACSGLQIVTTPFGARGFPAEVLDLCSVRELSAFAECLRGLQNDDNHQALGERTKRVRHWFERHRSWARIGDSCADAIVQLGGLSRKARYPKAGLVSVLIPMRNASPWIGECLASIQAQSYRDLEIIVTDDGSADGSGRIVAAAAVHDRRIRLVHHAYSSNEGVSRSIELALQHSCGDFVALCDADDIWMRDKLALQMSALNRHPQVVLCHTLCEVFGDVADRFLSDTQAHFDQAPENPCYHLLEQPEGLAMMHILTSSVLARSSALRSLPFAGSQAYQSEDHLICIMLAMRGPFLLIKERLTRYRLHKQGYTSRVLTNIFQDLYSRLEMLLILYSRVSETQLKQRIRAQIDGTLWHLECNYADDAPDCIPRLSEGDTGLWVHTQDGGALSAGTTSRTLGAAAKARSLSQSILRVMDRFWSHYRQ
jgi:glycosyltransferase involved in cell wall biosynthesis